MKFRSNQSGNVLWFILVAIVLLGAITLVVSRSGSNVEQSGDFEKQRIKATQLMRYTSAIEQAINKLQTINGCSENEISFENDTDTNYNNANSPGNNSCHIFEPEGAGLEWRALTDQTSTAFVGESLGFTGEVQILGIETDGGANANVEVLAFIPVSQSLCNHINARFSISTTASDITSDIDSLGRYTGSFNHTFDLGGAAGEAPGITGEPTGCIIDDNGEYLFYHVLIAR